MKGKKERSKLEGGRRAGLEVQEGGRKREKEGEKLEQRERRRWEARKVKGR